MNERDKVVRAAFRAEVASRGTPRNNAAMKSFRKVVKRARRQSVN